MRILSRPAPTRFRIVALAVALSAMAGAALGAVGLRPPPAWAATDNRTAAGPGRATARDGARAAQAPLDVVATMFPLAQTVALVGGDHVAVTDLTPPGTDPRTLRPDAADLARLRRAAVVVDVGGGFQPMAERAVGRTAAARRGDVLGLLRAAGGRNPYVWLDPATMLRLAPVVAATLSKADPANAGSYRQGAKDLQAQMSALDIDYRSDLSACPKSVIVTTEPTFGRLAARYDLTDVSIVAGYGPHPSASAKRIAAVAATVSRRGVSDVYISPLESSVLAAKVAGRAKVGLRTLDSIAGLTPDESRRHLSYASLMYDNLSTLSSSLGCPTAGF